MATPSDGRHRPRLRQPKRLTSLQPAEQEAGLQSCILRERRCLDFSVQPDEWFVFIAQLDRVYVRFDISSRRRRTGVAFAPDSQIVAAEREGRACYAIEVEPQFCDVIVRRWEDLSDKKAERAGEE